MVDYVIPANDDANRSVALILAVIADAIVESKGGIPAVAYVKDEGEKVTMKDVIRQTERENAEKLAKIRAERAARQEAYEKEQAARAAAKAEEGERKPRTRKPAKKAEAPKAEAPVAEAKVEGEN
jgi:small subunit ribosomal protein S2